MLAYGALLHDIGKIAVRSEVLEKPGPLSASEFEEMKHHSEIGAGMVARIPGLALAAAIVRHAHERWDGEGYPDGLIGEAIPLGARIVCACDALHAMTTDRPYRAALPCEEARAELRRGAGTQFDPEVVRVLLDVLRDD
jgi:HD-GYP domain-containing protein (c-di-GMP phosphodiesterase class II)